MVQGRCAAHGDGLGFTAVFRESYPRRDRGLGVFLQFLVLSCLDVGVVSIMRRQARQ